MLERKTRFIASLQGAIAFLLILQTILIGINAENHIQQGDSPIEVLIWMINQCIPVLKQASSFPEKQKKSLLSTRRSTQKRCLRRATPTHSESHYHPVKIHRRLKSGFYTDSVTSNK
ncbi:hypothetical protein [Nostoc sp.]|uniref:hypothetical protein n=1 Tax=Nostoc sp. TaxID=1180 RepID=UPI002FF92F3E